MLPFPEKFLDFHPQKFLMTFFSHRPQISNFPLIFPVSVHFPPVSRKLLLSPLLLKISPCFRKIPLLFTYFLCISFPPYFDHDAFMHHPMHVLDAPGPTLSQSTLEFFLIHCPNGRLGQDMGFGGFAFALKLPQLLNTNLAAVRVKLGQTSCFLNGPQIWCPIGQ